jgi:fumarylpyruvate hydrolase
MTDFAFPPPATPSVAISGSAQRFPVHRIYCVGRNYAEHVREMGGDTEREAPVFFTKPADAVMANDAAIPYPSRTSNLHHEIELVIAIGRGGRDIHKDRALDHVFGYAVGNDLTRRDLQAASKKGGLPWDTSKGFDCSAPLTAIRPVSQGQLSKGRIWLVRTGNHRRVVDAVRAKARRSHLHRHALRRGCVKARRPDRGRHRGPRGPAEHHRRLSAPI